MEVVKRFDVHLLDLDAVPGREARNTRLCVVISPDEMNRRLSSVIIAPVTSSNTPYPTRVRVEVLNAERMIVLDQIQTVDRKSLVKKVGELDAETQTAVLSILAELFA
ncbi:MAG: type II toxin-antitoxin system PemK/MazF family toxin [Chloracidobacterium sp.]|nr:type II toxin-antitoxin system PemK/MazF family toxin [Chloracidobacterium sp.]MCC6825273.1 type II toxin-antitoxin system PemK/MazF family toxin [Acidobacteriota bacterium]MCO5332543.1 type II toxin-antitoxin system PemK/MazF family toxin [Pyrinomonadaceae bacterium]